MKKCQECINYDYKAPIIASCKIDRGGIWDIARAEKCKNYVEG